MHIKFIYLTWLIVFTNLATALELAEVQRLKNYKGYYELVPAKSGENVGCLSGFLDVRETVDGYALTFSGMPLVIGIGGVLDGVRKNGNCRESLKTSFVDNNISFLNWTQCKSEPESTRVSRTLRFQVDALSYTQEISITGTPNRKIVCSWVKKLASVHPVKWTIPSN